MLSRLVLRQSIFRRVSSVHSHSARQCVLRPFSSSSPCLVRRHQGRSRSPSQKEEDPERSLSPEFLETLAKGEDSADVPFFEEEQEEGDEHEQSVPRPTTYWQWLEVVAPQFRDPKPRNWLGGDVPFPCNPTFKPPTPLSDALRSYMYKSYMVDPEANSVHALSARHNISFKRVDAILRLKGLEEAWNKGKPLQTGFTKGMESLLGVQKFQATEKQHGDTPLQYYHTGQQKVERGNDPSDTNPRYDAEEADRAAELEGANDMARFRYQRMFWENVPEGEESVMPAILEAARSSSRPVKHKRKVTIVDSRPGRLAIRFIDVGNAFVDVREQERRAKEGQRRALLRARRRGLEWAQLSKA